MLDENTIDELGALVLDEMHMVGDPHRGYIMELLVTKVLAIQLRIQVLLPFGSIDKLDHRNVGHYEECRCPWQMD
jgi:superfamily II helicase